MNSRLWRGLRLALIVAALTVVISVSAGFAFRRRFAGAALIFYTAIASLIIPGLVLSIGILDSSVRMGFLTFLPFLLQAKGATIGQIGLGLTLVFAGGATGKLVCGYLGAQLGVLATVTLTEGVTAIGILALLPMPFVPVFVLGFARLALGGKDLPEACHLCFDHILKVIIDTIADGDFSAFGGLCRETRICSGGH